jgi:MFS family permease
VSTLERATARRSLKHPRLRRERPPSRMFRALESPNLRRFFVGQVLSQSGTWVQKLAIGIFVLRITDSGIALGLATAAQFGPLLLLGPWAGVLCDRLDRHRLLLAVNIAALVVGTAFATIVVSGITSLWVIYVATLATGVVQAFENPTRRVFISDLVDPEHIQSAVGLNSTVMTICDITALAIAGVLIGGPGIEWCFVVNVVSFVPQLVLFARMDRSSLQPRTKAVRARGQSMEGIRYAWRNQTLRYPMILMGAAGMFGFGAHPVVVPLFATRDLGGGTGTYTLLFMCISLGEMIGSLASAQRASSNTRFLARTSIAIGLANLVLATAPNTALAALLALPVGCSLILLVAGTNAWLQTRADPLMRGRVLSLVSMVAIGSGALGGPLVGVVSEALGVRWAFVLAGLVSSAVGLGVLRRHLPAPSRTA